MKRVRAVPVAFAFMLASLSPVHSVYGHGGGEAIIEVGPHKGVTEVEKDRSFKLAPEAVKRLEIKLTLFGGHSVTLPAGALVRTLNDHRIFRLREGWYKSVDFKVLKRAADSVVVTSKDLLPGDSVVSGGVGFLRTIESQLGEAESETHEDGDSDHEKGEAYRD